MNNTLYDLAVIGGGINGCGVARDAAGRGLTVFLAEAGDLGCATSSASSKLIHGGLRYLEQYEFRLVRESLREREVLMRAAPHLVSPQRFVLPHRPGLRPAWLIRAGLLLYDTLGGRRGLPASGRIDLTAHHRDAALRPAFARGFEYADCRVDDARLVVAVAKDARRLGAVIAPRTRCESAARVGGLWEVALRAGDGGVAMLRARALVNATGPWVGEDFVVGDGDSHSDSGDGAATARPAIRLVQGSHIVVRKWYAGAHAYLLQPPDRRVVFVIPFAGAAADGAALALIGTTETDYRGDPAGAQCTTAEADYLRAAVAEYFAVDLAPADIVWSYSGVRPLFDDGAADAREVTRDYRLVLDSGDGGIEPRHPRSVLSGGGDGGCGDGAAPLVTIYGGKLTTFRKLAEAVMGMLAGVFPAAGPAWTADAVLPGARPGDGGDGVGARLGDGGDARVGDGGDARVGDGGDAQVGDGGIHPRHPRSPHPRHPRSLLSGGGGDGDVGGDGETVAAALRRAYPFLPVPLRARYAAAYGWEAFDVVGDAAALTDLGRDFGHGLYAREVDYLRAQEWARTADDILWRRSKLGLRFAPVEVGALEAFLRG